MPSEVLASNLHLINIGANKNRSMFRRRAAEEPDAAPFPSSPSETAKMRRRPLAERARAKLATTLAGSRGSTSDLSPSGLSESLGDDEYHRPAPEQTSDGAQCRPSPTHQRSTSGIKRKRPSLQTAKTADRASSRSAASQTSAKPPSSQASTSSHRSESPSPDAAFTSRPGMTRSSRSTFSLRQGLTKLAIDGDSPEDSPTRVELSRRRGKAANGATSRSADQAYPETSRLTRRASRQQGLQSRSEDGGVDPEEVDEDVDSEIDIDEEDIQGRAEEDSHLLLDAPPSQLERLRKIRLEHLSASVGLPSKGLTRRQLIDGILELRGVSDQDDDARPPSSNTRSNSKSNERAKASTFSTRSASADYTDEESDGDDAGHEGGGEETEAERLPLTKVANRRRRAGEQDQAIAQMSPVRRNNRKRRGIRANAVSPKKPLARFAESPAATASPMVNRLRKSKSIQFAASSPVRNRGRGRVPGKKLAPSMPDFSPLKPRPRKAKLAALGKIGDSEDDAPNSLWTDTSSKPADGRSKKKEKAVAKTRALAQGKQRRASEDEEMRGVDDQQTEASADFSDEEVKRVTDDDNAADADAEENDDDDDATEREDNDRDSEDGGDSDATDVAADDSRPASPGSPSKVRRLRNGKLRIAPAIKVQDPEDNEVEARLFNLSPPTTPTSSSATRSMAKKPPTPPLSEDNVEAQTAEAEGVDELNGLDLESLQLTDKEIPCRQLSKVSKIGSGGFKDVYVGIWKVGKRRNKVAIADIREKLTEMDIKELGLLRDLKHENIVRFIGVSIPDDTAKTGIPCMIVSELCAHGDLWDYVRNVKPPSNLQVFRMLLQTARGLEYLHMHSIVHRDVKSSNVLVTRNRSCKINDFGLARVKTSQRSKMKSVVGTVNWQAVELWCKQPQYNEKVDVWSTAMTFWETLQWYEDYKSYPFEGMNDFQIYEEVGKEGKRPPTDSIEKHFGNDIVKLLNRMWDADPRKRPTMDMICKDLERLIDITELEMEQ